MAPRACGGRKMNESLFYDMILDDEQLDFVKAIKDLRKTIVFCDAPAGTGKTTLAMGAANILVHDKRNELEGIVYIVSPYGEQKQGYLPGSITEKSEVYYEPAYQAMVEVGMNPNTDVYSESMITKKKGEAFVKMLTHTYLRGTNLQKRVVILDESQNYTVADLKKVLTRCHDSCKVIVIGHTGQIDIRGGSGFDKYLKHFEGQEKCAVCRLTTNHRGWLSTYADMLEDK
jgi:phosphate starvation-inducible protein PhoH